MTAATLESDRPMLSPRRALLVALVLSAVLHAFAIFGLPPLGAPPIPEEPRPLQARVIPPPPPPPVARTKPPPPKVARPKPRPAPPPPPPPAAITIPDPDPPIIAPVESEPAPVEVAEATPLVPGTEPAPAPAPAPEPAPAPAAQPSEPPPASAPATPAEKPPPAHYPLRRAVIEYDFLQGENPMRMGKVTHTFTSDGERYRAETIAEGQGFFGGLYGAIFGAYEQKSSGTFDAQGLQPREFTAHRGTRSDRLDRASFDWDGNQVSFTFRNGRGEAPLTAGVQDPISVLHQLYFMDPLPEQATIRIANGRKLGTYTLAILGREDLETPLGTISTLRVKRTDDSNDSLELWLDPARYLLPVRIQFIERRGTVFAQMIRSIELEGF